MTRAPSSTRPSATRAPRGNGGRLACPHNSPKLNNQGPEVASTFGYDFGAVAIHRTTPVRLQPKLAINQPGDAYEQEADRVAEQVMRMPDPTIRPSHQLAAGKSSNAALQRKCACGGTPGPDGECESCKKKREAGLQRKESATAASSPPNYAPPIVHEVLRSPGQPLEPALRHDMESRFGHDFSLVRVHTDDAAKQSARDVTAHAYTVGSDVVFGAGQFMPETHHGRRLIAHELTHVLQQSGSKEGPVDQTHGPKVDQRTADGNAMVLSQLAGIPATQLQRAPASPKQPSPADLSAIVARLEAIIRSGGEVPADTRVIGAAIVEVDGEGYKGSKERRAISATATDDLGHGATVPHDVTPGNREFSGTRSIAGSGARREFPFSHINDAEMKLFEGIAKDLSRDAKGTVHFMTMRVRQVKGQTVFEPYPACSGCTRASFEIAGKYPKMVIASHAPVHPPPTLDLGNAEAGIGSKGAVPSEAESEPRKIPQAKPPTSERGTPPAGNEQPLKSSGTPPNSINPPPPELPVPKETPGAKIPKSTLESPHGGSKVPALGEGESFGGRGRPGLGAGRAGRIGAAAAEGAAFMVLDVAMIATQLVIEFVVLPMLEKWMRQLEEKHREYLQKKIQQSFDKYQSKRINRTLRNCYLKKIRAAEAAGKNLYVKLDLKVRMEDTSRRLQPLHASAPDSPFDLDFDSTEATNVTLVDAPVKPSANQLACVAGCGVLDKGPSLPLTDNPVWERTITFSFAAPSADALLKEFPLEPGENLDAACGPCFIATACYGSPLAPEVEALRRFRDRRLIVTRYGRALVSVYYFTSPPLARWLEHHHVCRATVRRCFVGPLVHAVLWAGLDR